MKTDIATACVANNNICYSGGVYGGRVCCSGLCSGAYCYCQGTGASCSASKNCCGSNVCNQCGKCAASNTCKPILGSCGCSAQCCGSNMTCSGGQCKYNNGIGTCYSNGYCASGYCRLGLCSPNYAFGTGCSSTYQCSSPLICSRGLCVDEELNTSCPATDPNTGCGCCYPDFCYSSYCNHCGEKNGYPQTCASNKECIKAGVELIMYPCGQKMNWATAPGAAGWGYGTECPHDRYCSGACGSCLCRNPCTQQGKTCGTASNSCRTNVNCGTCAAGYMCNASQQCEFCDTCASKGYNCGSFTNNCGQLQTCGSCYGPQDCESNVCQCKEEKYEDVCKAIGCPAGTSSVVDGVALTNGLLGNWKMDQESWNGTSGEVIDSSENGYNGTAYNGANTVVDVSKGTVGSFAGDNDYVSMGNVLSFERTQPFSISAWVKKNRNNQVEMIVSKLLHNGTYRGYEVFFYTNNAIYFQLISNHATLNQILVRTNSAFTSTTNWYHVAVTYDGSSKASGVKIYVNGALQATTVGNNTLTQTTVSNANLSIGSRNNATYFSNIRIDDARIYNRALTVSDALTLATGTSPKTCNINCADYCYGSPWVQTKGADMRIESSGGYNYPVPESTYASTKGTGDSSGIIFTGTSGYSFCTDEGGCRERSSEEQWVVGGTSYPESFSPAKAGGSLRTSYYYVLSRVREAGIPLVSFTEDMFTDGLASGVVYTVEGDLNTPSSEYTFPLGKNYLILVNGNLTIKANIKVPQSSTATFVVKGNITVMPDVGVNPATACTSQVSNIEGFYSADGSFILDGEDDCTVGPDRRLNIAGSLVINAGLSGGIFDNRRTLCESNETCPVLHITERPDLILNAPEIIKYKNYIWKEEAP